MARFKVAGGIVFEVRLVASQAVFANVALARAEVWDNDAGVVAAFPANELGTGQRIDPTKTGTIGQGAVDPTSL